MDEFEGITEILLSILMWPFRTALRFFLTMILVIIVLTMIGL